VLADGSKRAGERIGKGCEKLSMQSGGQALPSHDPRHDVGLAWGYACDPAPGRHTPDHFKHSHDCGVAFPYSDRLNFPKLDSFDVEANAPIYAVLSSLDRLWTAAGLCLIGMWPETLPLTDFMSALTGWDFTLDEGIKAGHRINTLRQAFNIREGIDTTQWLLPERIAAVPDTGPLAGRKLDFKGMKERGYAALGWDGKTGKPLDLTLEELGLKELVGQLP